KGQALIGGNATHDGDRARYRDLMLDYGLADYRAMLETTAPVFFDRGIPELSGFGNASDESDPPALNAAIAECRYGETVFIFPPWPEIYTLDEERKHTFSHAVAVFAEVGATYRRFDYRTVEVPCVTVEERLRFVLEHIVAV
ncbi:MAG TPA: AAA family ATPase, partial [Rhizomicrobium sp.]|nr:AAA family ATPase [Rhizomicrobium sp.]